jgi:hypothetical protein
MIQISTVNVINVLLWMSEQNCVKFHNKQWKQLVVTFQMNDKDGIFNDFMSSSFPARQSPH